MPTLCSAFTTAEAARAAVDRLLAAGIAGDDIRLVMGEPVRDHRGTASGGFAGTRSGAAVGSFAGTGASTHDAMGGFAGEPARQRRGDFGDLDRETVTSYGDGIRRVHVASHRHLQELLVAAGLDATAAAADVDALHRGQVLVLVRASSAQAAAAALQPTD